MQFLKYGKSAPAMSNTERQRLFRQRHPGYYGRLHRRQKAIIDAMVLELSASPVAVPQRAMLLLPAPVQPTLFDDLATIPTLAELQQQRVLVERPA